MYHPTRTPSVSSNGSKTGQVSLVTEAADMAGRMVGLYAGMALLSWRFVLNPWWAFTESPATPSNVIRPRFSRIPRQRYAQKASVIPLIRPAQC